MRDRLTVLFVFVLLLFPSLCFGITPEEVVDIKPLYATDRVNTGSTFQIAIEMQIKKGWHINSNKPSNEFAIPTAVKLDPPQGISITDITFPEHQIMTLKSVGKVEIFSGKDYIIINGRADETLKPGTYKIPATFTYQACSDEVCLPPVDKTITFRLDIVPEGTPIKRLNSDVFKEIAPPEGRSVTSSTGFSVTSGGDISALIASRGMFITLVLIFLGGLALNLTPCVYPLIPITISYFGGMKHRGRGFVNALFYVLGIAVMYSTLGTAAALSGSMLGTQLTSPVVSIAISAIMVVLALSMFGLYEIRVPSFLMRAAGGEARSGVAGSFLMGITMGIVAAPCIGPFVLGLLTYVAAKGE
ncbi:MAG: thiol:disulfide interchange protein, partial [Nitrospirae bacterium]